MEETKNEANASDLQTCEEKVTNSVSLPIEERQQSNTNSSQNQRKNSMAEGAKEKQSSIEYPMHAMRENSIKLFNEKGLTNKHDLSRIAQKYGLYSYDYTVLNSQTPINEGIKFNSVETLSKGSRLNVMKT